MSCGPTCAQHMPHLNPTKDNDIGNVHQRGQLHPHHHPRPNLASWKCIWHKRRSAHAKEPGRSGTPSLPLTPLYATFSAWVSCWTQSQDGAESQCFRCDQLERATKCLHFQRLQPKTKNWTAGNTSKLRKHRVAKLKDNGYETSSVEPTEKRGTEKAKLSNKVRH